MAIYDNIEALESSPPDTATDPSGAESELYEWNDKRHTLAIQNDKSSGVDMGSVHRRVGVHRAEQR